MRFLKWPKPEGTRLTERRAAFRRRLAVWAGCFAVGLWLGPAFISEPSERLAAPMLYSWRQASMPPPRIRFIDLSHLYTIGSGRVSAKDLTILIRAASKLDREHRPAAIAVDLPVFKPKGQDQTSFQVPAGTEELLALVRQLDRDMPVVIGVGSFVRAAGLEHLGPGLSDRFASAYLYAKGDLAVMAFGDGTRSDLMPSLGIAVAQEAARKDGSLESSGHAFGPSHLVEPPADWPQNLVPAPKWMIVDYSILSQREALTVTAGSALQEGQTVSEGTLFSADDLALLAARSHAPIWFVGISKVQEADDTFVYDPHSRWLSEGEPIRRLYQHGAIAHTYLDQPLRRVEGWGDKGLDALCSLLGLILVLLADRFLPSLERNELGRAILKVVLLSVAVGAAIFISRMLAGRGFFWFGFAGTAIYALVEGFIGPVFEGLLAQFHRAPAHEAAK